MYCCCVFFQDLIYSFLEKWEEKERNISVWLPLMRPVLGIRPATQACALTGNRTGNPLVHSPYSIHWATPAGYMYHNCLIHSFTDGHLAYLQNLAIVNCAAMHNGVHRFIGSGVSGSLGYNSSSEIAGSKSSSIFSFLRKFHSFPQWLHQSAIPPTVH